MIGISVGPVVDHIPQWRRDRGAVTGNVVHALAAMWHGPACNNGVDPAARLVTGWEIEAPAVTCGACRALGGAR